MLKLKQVYFKNLESALQPLLQIERKNNIIKDSKRKLELNAVEKGQANIYPAETKLRIFDVSTDRVPSSIFQIHSSTGTLFQRD